MRPPLRLALCLAGFAALVALLAPAAAEAQDHVLSVPSATVDPLASTEIALTLDNATGGTVSALSCSICFDPAVVTATAAVQGSATIALEGGTGPDYYDASIIEDAILVGIVATLIGGGGYVPASDHELLRITFEATGAPSATSPLAFCVAGTPPINNVVIHAPNQTAASPTTIDGLLTVGPFQGARLAWRAETAASEQDLAHATLLLDVSEPVVAFSCGTNFDASLFSLGPVTAIGPLAESDGGNGPELFLVAATAGGDGFTIECVVDGAAVPETIAPGFDLPLVDAAFVVGDTSTVLCTTTALTFTDTLGTPPVANLVTASSGALTTVTADGQFRIVEAPATPPTAPAHLFVDTVAGTPGSPVTISVALDHEAPVEAFSFGLAFDPTDLSLFTIALGDDVAATRCGAGPAFFDLDVVGGGSGGLTTRVQIESTPPFEHAVLLPSGASTLLDVTFSTSPNPTVGGSALTLTSTLGNPVVPIEITTPDGVSTPTLEHGGVSLGTPFRRGDCNDDGSRDIADAVAILSALFPPTPAPPPPPCDDACEANDDGTLDIADAIFLLGFLFTQGDEPPPPGGSCGVDGASPDPLGCANSSACP